MQLEPMMRARAAKLQAAGPQTANAVENMQNRLADAGADAGAAAGAPIVDNSVTNNNTQEGDINVNAMTTREPSSSSVVGTQDNFFRVA